MPPVGDSNPDISERVEQIILKATEKSPSKRYQSADDMLDDLKRALGAAGGNINGKNGFSAANMGASHVAITDGEIELIKREAKNLYYDYDELEDEDESSMIRAPINYRTMAEIYGEGDYSYQYNGTGDLSWAIPYAAGVLAMGWQVRPELTADEMLRVLMETAYVDHEGYKFIFPAAFIEYLQNY